jgi:CRISPR-associated protein Cmr3
MSKIILKITPVDYYFFGAENINGITKEANYFQKSNKLPQQTTILGALRYALLLNAKSNVFLNNKIIDKEKASALIGEKSFDLSETEFSFGSIMSISPVFLIHNNERFIPCPIINETHSFELIAHLPFIKEYNAKDEYGKKYSNGKEYIEEDKIFKPLILVQNKKDKKTKEDAFFKTQYYTLKEDWAFGIEIELSDEELLPVNFTMKMGGENRLFTFEKIKLEISDKLLDTYISQTYHAITLISDAYIELYDAKDVEFAIINTIPFRHLQSTVKETKKYTHRSKKDDDFALKESKLTELIEKGSIFYFKDETSSKKIVDKLKINYLQKCGLNHYIILTPNKN